VTAVPRSGQTARPLGRWLLPLALVPVLLVGVAWVYFRFVLTSPYEGRYARPFEREAWIAAADDPEGARFLMVEDLLSRGLLEGLTLAQAGELLGPPTDTAHFSGLGPCWYLGPEPGFMSIDSAWLVLELEIDRVVGGRVLTD
jgi:hypothetical protein